MLQPQHGNSLFKRHINIPSRDDNAIGELYHNAKLPLSFVSN